MISLPQQKTFNFMRQPDKISSRKKFIVWGAAVLTSLTAFKIFSGSKKASQTKPATVKMLTQDGKLVEVDADKIYCGKRKKISDDQLKKWVKKNQHNQTRLI
jgi:hypothetical protein